LDLEFLDSIRSVANGVTARFDRAYFLDRADRREHPVEMWEAMAAQGLLSLGVSEQLGGSGGGVTATATVMDAMSAAGVPPILYLLTTFVREAIIRHGTPSQIEEHVVPTVTGDRKFCFAITEPDAGTNSFGMRAMVRPGPSGSYIAQGQKVFTSGADWADHMLLVARTSALVESGPPSEGLSLFVVDMATPGIELHPMGIEWYAPERQFSVFFDDVVLNPDSLIGVEGQGAKALFDCLNAERVMVSAWALGIGEFALSKGVAYANTRAPFGVPIGTYQAVQHPLARARAELDAARALMYQAAERYDDGQHAASEASAAKLLASEAACRALDATMQAHGGYAFVPEYDVVTLWPMIRSFRVAPINNEMILNNLARTLGLPKSY
jgi:alkylation response protein AidB-like acyl-CoA dehydrogenase